MPVKIKTTNTNNNQNENQNENQNNKKPNQNQSNKSNNHCSNNNDNESVLSFQVLVSSVFCVLIFSVLFDNYYFQISIFLRDIPVVI